MSAQPAIDHTVHHRDQCLPPADDDDTVVLVRLGEATVAVRSTVAWVRETIAQFYPVAATGVPQWTVTAFGEPAPAEVVRNGFGVGVRVDPLARQVTVWSASVLDLAVTVRKIVREVFLGGCERAGHTMVHASAIYTDEQVVIFAADKRGGKTTLALRAVLDHGWRWLSNDHLIVLPDGQGGLGATSLPTLIPVKAGTLVELWDRLPAPWDLNGFDISVWQQVPARQLHAADDAAYFTFAGFGQPNPVVVPLDSRQVTVVFPCYAPGAQTGAGLIPVNAGDTAAELLRHVRTDGLAPDRGHQRNLPLDHRDPGTFAADSARLTQQLTGLAGRGRRFTHYGDPRPLFDTLIGDC